MVENNTYIITTCAIDYMRADSAIGFLNFFEGVKILLT